MQNEKDDSETGLKDGAVSDNKTASLDDQKQEMQDIANYSHEGFRIKNADIMWELMLHYKLEMIGIALIALLKLSVYFSKYFSK